MKYPNFNEEKKLWKQGFNFVAGLDEAGRGPLAGPVVAGAVAIINPNDQIPKRFGHPLRREASWKLGLGIFEVKDSKKMSGKQREEVYKKLIECENIAWGIGIVSEKVIDKINILEATKLAMQKAVKNLEKKSVNLAYININDRSKSCGLDFVLIDGNFKLDFNEAAFAKGYGVPKQKSIVKGDQKVFSVASASIIAKVTRDRLMRKYHKKYPQYGFDKHKGYGTKAHFANLEKFGPCKIHRRSFWPVSHFS